MRFLLLMSLLLLLVALLHHPQVHGPVLAGSSELQATVYQMTTPGDASAAAAVAGCDTPLHLLQKEHTDTTERKTAARARTLDGT
jgi:hypothetical protein